MSALPYTGFNITWITVSIVPIGVELKLLAALKGEVKVSSGGGKQCVSSLS